MLGATREEGKRVKGTLLMVRVSGAWPGEGSGRVEEPMMTELTEGTIVTGRPAIEVVVGGEDGAGVGRGIRLPLGPIMEEGKRVKVWSLTMMGEPCGDDGIWMVVPGPMS